MVRSDTICKKGARSVDGSCMSHAHDVQCWIVVITSMNQCDELVCIVCKILRTRVSRPVITQ
jgi:hypothetical protein